MQFLKNIPLLLFVTLLSSSYLHAQIANDPLKAYQKNQIIIPFELKKDIIVAVIDTGLDIQHPDLKDNIALNQVECDNGQPQSNNIQDRDNNGFPGDCLGWNFIPNEAAADAAPEQISSNESAQIPSDMEGHGTHVGGIIAAVANNKIGLSNSSNHIKIIPLKVFPKSYQTRTTFRIKVNGQIINTNRSNVLIQAIDYAIKRKVDVINFSIGWNKNIDSIALREKINQAMQNGIAIVAAAGNDSAEVSTFPCLYENVICVGASDDNKALASISNYGNGVDLIAPGMEVLSTFPLNQIYFRFLNGYEIYSGTSQAAPYTSKLIAILKGLYPSISNIEILQRLYQSSTPIIFLQNKQFITSGVIDAGKAISISQKELNSQITIIPSFKNLNQAVLDNELRATLSIPVHIFAPNGSTLKISLEAQSPDMNISQPILFTVKKMENTTTLKFDLKVNNLQANQKQSFTLKFNDIKNKINKNFKFNTKLFLSTIEAKNIFDFKSQTVQPYFSIRGSEKGTALKNIPNLYSEKTNYFFVEFFSKKDDVISSRITLHLLTPTSFNEIANTTFNDVVKSYGLKTVDLNHDGISEFIYTTEAIDSETKKRYVKVYYLNQELKPVYADVPYLRYELLFPLFFDNTRNPLYPLGNISMLPMLVDGKILPQIVVFHDTAILNNFKNIKQYYQSNDGLGPDLFFFKPELKDQKWTYTVTSLSAELLEKKWLEVLPDDSTGKIKSFTSLCKDCSNLQFATIYGKGKLETLKNINTQNKTISSSIHDLSSYATRYDPIQEKLMAVNVYTNNKIHILDLTYQRSWWGNLPHSGPWRVLQILSLADQGARVLLTDGMNLVKVQAKNSGSVTVADLDYGKYFGTTYASSSELFDLTADAEDSYVQLLGNKISDLGLSFIDISGDNLALAIDHSFIQKTNCLALGNFHFPSLKSSNFIQLCQQSNNNLIVETY